VAALRQVAGQMHRRDDVKLLIREILSGLCQLEIPVRSCGVNLIEPEGEGAAIRVYRSDDAPGPLADDDPGAQILRRIWQDQRVAYRPDLLRDDPWGEAEWMLPHGVRSVVDVPFAQGTLAANSAEPGAFTGEHVDILREMAGVLSDSLARLQEPGASGEDLAPEEIHQRRHARADAARRRLREAVWDMQSPDDLHGVLDVVRCILEGQEFTFSYCGINLIDDPENPGWVRGYTTTWDGQWREVPLREAGAVEAFWREGKVRYRPDLADDDPYGEREDLITAFGMNIRSVVDVPFAQGTLALSSIWENAYTETDIHVLQHMGTVLSEGFSRWRDLEALRQQAVKLRRANELLSEKQELLDVCRRVGEVSLATLELEEVVARLPLEILRAGLFRSLSFSLVDDEARTVAAACSLRRTSDGGLASDLAEHGRSYPLDDSDILAQVARTGDFEMVEGWDEERYAPRAESPDEYADKVAYFVPVKMRDRVLAVLATASRTSEKERTLRRISLMEPLLSQVAITLEHARLLRQVQRESLARQEEQRRLQAEETVRLSIALMEEPHEFGRVVAEISSQLSSLGLAHDLCSVQVVNEAGTDYLSGSPDAWPRKYSSRHPFFTQGLAWEKASSLVARFPWVTQVFGTGEPHYDPDARHPSFPVGSSVVDVPFSHGTLAVRAHRPHAFESEDIELLQRFARVLSDGFQRFLDLIETQKAADELRAAYEQMESRVRERTAQLEDANARLRLQIDERLRAEKTLQESETFLKKAEQIALVGTWKLDVRHRHLAWSAQMFRIFGIEPAGFDGTLDKGFETIHPDDRGRVRSRMQAAIDAREAFQIEYRVLRPDDSVLWAETRGEVVCDESGGVAEVIGTVQDITDRKRMEEELRRIHNLESLGVLAGGIAHDFNNMLTGVLTNAEHLTLLLEPGSRGHSIAVETKEAADRTRDLTAQLMTFARGGEPVKESASIEELLRTTAELLLRGSNTRATFDFPERLPSVEVDTGQIGQVVQNLVLNADQAMPNGGVLRISAVQVELAAGDVSPLQRGAYLRVTVADQGVGIPGSAVHQIFDPYYTTKASGHGLGLSIAHSIILRHDGHIAARSEPGVGTTFDFYLPVAEARPAPPVESEQSVVGGTGRILLMDDDETVRKAVREVLELLGYQVACSSDGEQALAAYREAMVAGAPFDVVIMDLTVPGGMGGQRALERLIQIDPGARAIVTSGYANDPVMAGYAEYGFVGKVAKPVRVRELADTVRRALASE